MLFHETVGRWMEGNQQGDDREGKTFRGQEGKPGLPVFLSTHDDPALRTLDEDPLNGYHLFDEEGEGQ
jgi:TldD protein